MRACDEFPVNGLNLLSPIIFFLASKFCRSSQHAFEVQIEISSQSRNGFISQTVSSESGVRIRGVLAPLDSFRSCPFADLVSADIQQGTEQPVGGDRPHAGQSGQTTPSHQAEQHSLGLIATSVTQGDALKIVPSHATQEKIEAGSPRFLL